MKNKKFEADAGNSLLIVIGIVGLVSIIAAAILMVSRTSTQQTTVNRATIQARAAAESGLDYLAALLGENRGHDSSVKADLVTACKDWLANPASLTRKVGPAANSDGTFTVKIQTADSVDGTWSNNCNGDYLRLFSTGTADDMGSGTSRGSTAKMISIFKLPEGGTPGTPGSNLPAADLWDFSGNGPVTRGDAANTTFNANTPTVFSDVATGGNWVRIISDANGNNKGTAKSFWQNGYMLLKQPFNTSENLTVDFDYRMYNQLPTSINFGGTKSGDEGLGDGFSFFFVDAANAPTKPGAFGAGLGYAPAANQGGNFAPYTPGIKGGYLGIGVDAYGNYQKAEKSAPGYCNWGPLNDLISGGTSGGATRSSSIYNCLTTGDINGTNVLAGNPDSGQMDKRKPNSISIRGAGNSTYSGDTPWQKDDWKKALGFLSDDFSKGGYRWLKGSQSNLGLGSSAGVAGLVYNEYGDSAKTEKYRHVRFVMKKVSSNQHNVELWLSKKIFTKTDQYSPTTYDQTGSGAHWIKFDIQHIEQNSSLKNGYIPSEIRYGIAASSGWASATVEIGNLALKSGETVIEPLEGSAGSLGTLLSKNDLSN